MQVTEVSSKAAAGVCVTSASVSNVFAHLLKHHLAAAVRGGSAGVLPSDSCQLRQQLSICGSSGWHLTG